MIQQNYHNQKPVTLKVWMLPALVKATVQKKMMKKECRIYNQLNKCLMLCFTTRTY